MTRYGFRLPDEQAALLQRVNVEKALVGLACTVTFMGTVAGSGTVVAAKWYDDPMLGRGVWVDIDADSPRVEQATKGTGAR